MTMSCKVCLLPGSVIALCAIVGCCNFAGSSYVDVPDAEHSAATRRHTGIPSVAVAPGGRLWATWYGSPTGGEDSNNYCTLATSADEGGTWQDVLVADPDGIGPKRAFDPEVWVAPNGRLHWTWTERVAPLQKDAKDANAGCLADPKKDRLMGVMLDANELPAGPFPEPREICRGVMMCKPIVLDDGTWLWPSAHWSDAPSSCFYASTDVGKTFSFRGGVTLPEPKRSYDEHAVVQLANGDLLTLIRTVRGPKTHQSISHDRGRTWTAPTPANFRHTDSRLFLRKLKSGHLLLVKHGAIDKDVGRQDLTAFVSTDDGATWKGGLLIDERKDVSYPDGDQAADGTIYIVHDHDRRGAQEILISRFTEDDVLAGKLVNPSSWLARRIVSAENK